MDERLLLLSPEDNVFVLRGAIDPGEVIVLEEGCATAEARLGLGHKIARRAIARDAPVIKYGARIGTATRDIAPGTHVHLHNLRSDYTATYALAPSGEVPT